MNRSIVNVCALLLIGCASVSAAERVGDGRTAVQSDVDLPVPQKMLGTWILIDTAQCANPTDKIIVTPAAVQFGRVRSDRMRFIPKSGAFGGDALHWWVVTKEEVLEYDSENDRIIWQSGGADSFTVDYYERCNG